MNPIRSLSLQLAWAGLLALPISASAYNSGSTGADGAFNPTVNTQLQLPPSGVFNFTSVNVPVGVTVTFRKNATNTPVVMLASGNVTIAGSIILSGSDSTHVGASGDGNLGDDGLPGTGGPGGYDGGRGGQAGAGTGGDGLGAGGGGGGAYQSLWGMNYFLGGGGAGYSTNGGNASGSDSYRPTGKGGVAYGTSALLPLIGGGGGGGGAGGNSFAGSGGGGGGAILIASSGTVSVTGGLWAYGGASGLSSGGGCGARGGYGSGGAIRIVATTITGNGALSTASAGSGYGTSPGCQEGNYSPSDGGQGSDGRIRLEAETFTRTATSTPAHSFSPPGTAFVAGFPTLRIASVAGVAAPLEPTGTADITLPSTTPNPVMVTFATTGVPVGNTVKLTLTPSNGASTTVVSPALTGTTDSASASVSINLPSGPSVLQATTTYTIVVAMGEALSKFAQGERVEKVTLVASPGQANKVILTTISGKEFEAPHAALAMLGS